ncbi:MAG: response regulator [Peptostreptococcaceae bacterium]|nr:response regulator [Peptostreptococcaceae bacterium]
MKKILVIDDNRLTLKLILVILNVDFPDYKIMLSKSGIEGIEIAKRELPDTILLDILMPEMDGFEVCTILKGEESTKHIPILLVSDLSEISFRIKGLNSGADAFISKPIDKTELKAQVNVMLRIKFAEDLLRKRNKDLEILIKKQTTEFKNVEERYLTVLEYTLEYFWEVDKNGQFIYVSPAIVRILGFNSEEIVDKKTLFNFFSNNGNTEATELLEGIFARRDHFAGNEILYLHENGEKIWLTVSGLPVFDRENNFAGYIGVTHNVTRRREAEEANQKHQEEINEYQKKLKNLYNDLTVAEEMERRKIAEYLHEDLGQTISIASIKLSSIARGNLPSAVKKTLEESSELLREAIDDSRVLVYDLSPPILYEFGLIAAIKWKLEQVEKLFGGTTMFSAEENSIELESNITVFLFRMVCELLNNIIKHAGADLIKVKIQKNPKSISITVFDNGKGFEFSPLNLSKLEGFGLFRINERLDCLQGSLMIESKPSQGAEITVTVPILNG